MRFVVLRQSYFSSASAEISLQQQRKHGKSIPDRPVARAELAVAGLGEAPPVLLVLRLVGQLDLDCRPAADARRAEAALPRGTGRGRLMKGLRVSVAYNIDDFNESELARTARRSLSAGRPATSSICGSSIAQPGRV
jgi:hypothetical protein